MAASSVCAFAFAGALMGMLAGASVPTLLVGLYALDGPEPPAAFSPLIWGLKQGILIGLLIGTAGVVLVLSWGSITSCRPRMTTRRWMVVVAVVAIAVGVSIFVQRWLKHRRRIEQIGQVRVELASKAYNEVERALVSGQVDVETFYRWSRRLMECELDISRSRTDRIAAIRGHQSRLSMLWSPEGFGKQCKDQMTLDTIDFYRIEAELWLAKEE